jgi:tight adherence protein B
VEVYVIAAFALVFAIVMGVYWLFIVLPEGREQRQLQKRLTTTRSVNVGGAGLAKQPEEFSSVASVNNMMMQAGGVFTPLQRSLSEAGVKMNVGTFMLASLFSALVVYVLLMFYTHQVWAAAIGAAIGSSFPYGYVRYQRNRRMQRFEEQFPEAIELIARTLRAGHAFTTGLELAGEELPDPVGTEFKLLYDLQMFGQPLPDALKAFAARIPLIDARFFVTAVLTQREAGGNLAEVLDNLAAVIRERFRVKRQVRVLSAHGRITGLVLSLLPPVLAFLIFAKVPSQMMILVNDPIGPSLIIAAVTLQIIGMLAIRKLVKIEY